MTVLQRFAIQWKRTPHCNRSRARPSYELRLGRRKTRRARIPQIFWSAERRSHAMHGTTKSFHIRESGDRRTRSLRTRKIRDRNARFALRGQERVHRDQVRQLQRVTIAKMSQLRLLDPISPAPMRAITEVRYLRLRRADRSSSDSMRAITRVST